jgi:hypothetical protein
VTWIEAYKQREIEYQKTIRLQTFLISPNLGKVSWEKFKRDYWPLPDEAEETKGKTRRLLDRLKNEKDKVNGNGKTGNTG